MKVLVIYEVIPEESNLYLVDMTQEEYEFFKQTHEYIVNVDDYDEDITAVNTVISNAICGKPEHFKYAETEDDKKYFGKWADSKLTNQDGFTCDAIIHTGFYL